VVEQHALSPATSAGNTAIPMQLLLQLLLLWQLLLRRLLAHQPY
jgi:hypothetical protein